MFLDRPAERAALRRLLQAPRAGRSGVLVVRGGLGVGKSALLEDAVASAADLRIARADGVESEMELAFAALHQLVAPMLDKLERLPAPQRDALGMAFGLRAGGTPDRFLVGLATLSLLAEVAAEQPLLCVIDDAQWLDRASAQALGFVGRRLLAEPVALVICTREQNGEFSGLPELLVPGLGYDDARKLLDSVVTGPLDERVRDRIVAETQGNPLALVELPRALTVAELAGGFAVPGAPGLAGRIEDSFRRRLEALPAPAKLLLLAAAAEPAGDPALLWRAAGQLGIGPESAAAACEAGLLTIGERAAFRHPLVRSAVYHDASAEERRAVHQALADATDPEADPDRRAWHRAQAVLIPDEEVAAELEASAGRAQARGGLAAAGVFLERSAALTLDPARRAARTLAAAQARYQAGAFDAALGLISTAEARPLDELQRARVSLLRAQIAFGSSHRSDAPPLFVKAAQQFEPLDGRMAREICLDAFPASLSAGGSSMRQIAEAALAAGPLAQPARAPDLLLDGLALLITKGYPAGAPVLKDAMSAFRAVDVSTEQAADVSSEEEVRCLYLATIAARLVWDYESWDALAGRLITAAHEAGALIALHQGFGTQALVRLFAGRFAEAVSLVAVSGSVTDATDCAITPYAALTLAAFRGGEAEAAGLIEASTKDNQRRGEGAGLSFTHWAAAVLHNGSGRYEQARAAAQQASQDSPAQWPTSWALVELIEAAARSGAPGRATDAFQRLSESTRASGTDWALGIEARSRALVSGGETAETDYRAAIDRLGRARLRVELGRAHLLYGEWLRRQQRRRDARDQLGRAHEILDSAGADAFAKRAHVELRACGGQTARKRSARTPGELTPQEAQIAKLAREGLSNPEIGGRLFISARTAEYHLSKVFTKLGITSRSQLDQVLP
jgi:DNA-binding CsgD family transcriptional regulator